MSDQCPFGALVPIPFIYSGFFFLNSNFNCLGWVEVSGLCFYFRGSSVLSLREAYFSFHFIVFIDSLYRIIIIKTLSLLLFHIWKKPVYNALEELYTSISIFVNSISIIFNILKFTVKTRSPKGHISCSRVQCATFWRICKGDRLDCLIDRKKKTKQNLGTGRWDLASCQVSLNSAKRFQRRSQNVSANQRPGGHLGFPIGPKKTQTW